jgi:hypothetical protein
MQDIQHSACLAVNFYFALFQSVCPLSPQNAARHDLHCTPCAGVVLFEAPTIYVLFRWFFVFIQAHHPIVHPSHHLSILSVHPRAHRLPVSETVHPPLRHQRLPERFLSLTVSCHPLTSSIFLHCLSLAAPGRSFPGTHDPARSRRPSWSFQSTSFGLSNERCLHTSARQKDSRGYDKEKSGKERQANQKEQSLSRA